MKVTQSPSIRAVTFEEASGRTRTVTDADAVERALLSHCDVWTKEYRHAVKSLVKLAEGTIGSEKARQDFIAALKASGVFVHEQ